MPLHGVIFSNLLQAKIIAFDFGTKKNIRSLALSTQRRECLKFLNGVETGPCLWTSGIIS
jgi:hypothetical protein